MCPLIRQEISPTNNEPAENIVNLTNNLIELYRVQLSFASYKQSPNVDGCVVQYKEMLLGLSETRLLPFNASVKSPCFLSNKLTIQYISSNITYTGAFYYLLCFIDCFPIRILAKAVVYIMFRRFLY